jgi:ubiquinone/menaquinone biosynthesis C-methylase UbiE
MHMHSFDPEHLLESEKHKSKLLPAEKILLRIIENDNQILADIGCGTGYFTIPAAKLLKNGKVLAIDRQQNMLEITARRAQENNLTNVITIQAESHNMKEIGASSVDIAFMSMVFHDIHERSKSLEEIKRILKPKGFLYLIEWDKIQTDFGPPLDIRMSPAELASILEESAYHIVELYRSEAEFAIYFVKASPEPVK